MIGYGKQHITKQDIEAVIDTLSSDFLTTGPKVDEFEQKICEYTGANFAVVCGNGTQALHITYSSLNWGPGDEVIIPANTFVATANMVLLCGATPIFCDIKPDTYNIDEEKIENLITDKTKAIVPVHFAGQPCEMDVIWGLAKKHNLDVVEDAAHALGSGYKKKKIGNGKSKAVTFSFHPVKPITTGEGGAVVTNDEALYKRMNLIRSHGIERSDRGFNDMVTMGHNYRLSDIQCALGVSQLKKLDRFIKKRKQIVELYNEYLDKNNIVLPQNDDAIHDSGWHLYVVKFENKEKREKIMKILRKNGYGVTLHYPPVYTHTYYQNNGYKDTHCNNAEKYYETCLSLPIFYELEEKDIKQISSLINDNL